MMRIIRDTGRFIEGEGQIFMMMRIRGGSIEGEGQIFMMMRIHGSKYSWGSN